MYCNNLLQAMSQQHPLPSPSPPPPQTPKTLSTVSPTFHPQSSTASRSDIAATYLANSIDRHWCCTPIPSTPLALTSPATVCATQGRSIVVSPLHCSAYRPTRQPKPPLTSSLPHRYLIRKTTHLRQIRKAMHQMLRSQVMVPHSLVSASTSMPVPLPIPPSAIGS